MSPASFTVAAVGGAVVMTAGSQIAAGRRPRAALFIGGTIAAAMLSALAGIAPALARALAGLIILGSLLGAGYSLTQPLRNLLAA